MNLLIVAIIAGGLLVDQHWVLHGQLAVNAARDPETVAGKQMKTYVDWLAPTFLLSMSGLPIASVPCGLDASRMPVGLQIVGRPRGEEAVLALAALVQEMNPIGLPR